MSAFGTVPCVMGCACTAHFVTCLIVYPSVTLSVLHISFFNQILNSADSSVLNRRICGIIGISFNYD